MELILIPGAAILLSVLIKNIITQNTLDKILEKYKGTPYKWGGTTPNGFDCSGFTQYVFKTYFNKTIPRVAAQQATFVTKTTNPKAGDLVFFATPGSNTISHVGIYSGNNEMIHSGSSKGIEKVSLSNPYWAERLKFYGKI
jgi:murein DD-endopeptidase / murein LD-carboxypeptidase